MSTEKVIIAHCSANAEVAKEIAQQLQSSDFQFEIIAGNQFETGLQEILANTTDKVILLLSDNYLKSIQCMDGGLAYLQRLINTGRILPVIIDGQYPNPEGNGFVTVPTKFERVSSVIKYMNHWQDEYLEMRKQKRFVPSDQEEAFSSKLKSVRAVSSDVGEFLRFLRDSYSCDYDTFKANHFQLFFQKFSDQSSYNTFSEKAAQNPVASILGTGAAIGMAAAATTKMESSSTLANDPADNLNGATKTTTIAEPLVSNTAAIEVHPTTSVEQVQEEVAVETPEIQEETIDDIVNEILQEQSKEAENVSNEVTPVEEEVDVADTELLAQELAQKLPSPEIIPSTPPEHLEELVNVETALEDLSKQNAKNLALQQNANEEAIMQNGLDMLEVNETPIVETQKLISESDLLRRSHELIQQGALQDGLHLLDSQLKIKPDMIAARYQYSVFLAQFQKDYQLASEQLQKIIQIEPKNLPANFFLGELAEAQGDFLNAKHFYETVEEINPNFPNLHYKLGLLLARRYKDQADAAVHHLHEAYAQNPRNIDALYNWGLVQNESLNKPKSALSAFMKVAAEVPNHPFVNYDIALAYYKLNDRKAAQQFYKKAGEINPELKTTENDLAFAVSETQLESTEELSPVTAEPTIPTSDNISEVALNGSVNTPQIEEEEIQETVVIPTSNNGLPTPTSTPDYTLDLNSEPKNKTVLLQELIEEETVEIEINEQEVDEEQLEAEFDATIGALGAAGLGIAAGAAINSHTENTIEVETAPITTPTIEAEEINATQSSQQNTTKTDYIPTNVVLITGATSGIGKATAALFAENGYDLILTGRRFSRLFKLKEEFEALYQTNIQLLPFDVRSAAAVQTAIDDLPVAWKNIDILVNNAGLALGFEPIHEGHLKDWETMIDTNIKGLLYMTRAIAPYMVRRKKGHIINISSIAGKEVYPNGNVYCATKHAVEALTKAIRIDLHKYNIRVSQIAPGHVEETEFAKVRFHGDQERAKIYEDFVPVNSKDIAETIHFVASRPPHVNIQDILVMGTQQASATITDRSGRETL